MYERRTDMPVSAPELYRWHARPGAFSRLVPAWESVRVLSGEPRIDEDGARFEMRVGRPPLAFRWVAEQLNHEEGRRFVDVQRRGPFARWVHEHLFERHGPDACTLVDRIDWALPAGLLGAAVGGRAVRRRLDRTFAYRHAVTRADLERHRPWRDAPPLRVAVTGSSGLLGTALCDFLTTGGHEVLRVVRRPARGPGEISWEPEAGRIEREKLEALDAVVHLAGENIAAGRWTDARMAAILASRTKGTRLLARTLPSLASPPKAFLSASASGYYGPRGDAPVDESAPSGSGFLGVVCRGWEEAADHAARRGIRTAILRFGVLLSPRGGALAKMLPAFRLGAGGPIGGGRQGFPWIALDDAVYAIHHLIRTNVAGPVNVVAPRPVPQREFARTLGRVLRRPAVAPLPAFAVKLLFGQLGEEALLSGAFLVPAALVASGFTFTLPDLEAALARDLGRL